LNASFSISSNVGAIIKISIIEKTFAKGIEQDNTLQVLLLCGNHISNTGLVAMADAIKVNTKLCKLELCRTQDDFIDYRYGIINYTYFFQALEYNTTIQKI
jgi:hypothetical protein